MLKGPEGDTETTTEGSPIPKSFRIDPSNILGSLKHIYTSLPEGEQRYNLDPENGRLEEIITSGDEPQRVILLKRMEDLLFITVKNDREAGIIRVQIGGDGEIKDALFSKSFPDKRSVNARYLPGHEGGKLTGYVEIPMAKSGIPYIILGLNGNNGRLKFDWEFENGYTHDQFSLVFGDKPTDGFSLYRLIMNYLSEGTSLSEHFPIVLPDPLFSIDRASHNQGDCAAYSPKGEEINGPGVIARGGRIRTLVLDKKRRPYILDLTVTKTTRTKLPTLGDMNKEDYYVRVVAKAKVMNGTKASNTPITFFVHPYHLRTLDSKRPVCTSAIVGALAFARLTEDKPDLSVWR